MPKPTPYGQRLLDAICEKVEEELSFAWIGFDVGNTDQIVKYLSKRFGKSVKSIAGAISDLIEKEFLWSGGERETHDPKLHGTLDESVLGISHNGWKQFSGWSVDKIDEVFGEWAEDWEYATALAFWEDWDGANGMEYPREYTKPNWKIQ